MCSPLLGYIENVYRTDLSHGYDWQISYLCKCMIFKTQIFAKLLLLFSTYVCMTHAHMSVHTQKHIHIYFWHPKRPEKGVGCL